MAKFDFVTNIDDGKSEFDRSLSELCAYDVAPVTEKKRISGSTVAFNVFRYGLLFLFIGIFVYCVYMIGRKSTDYARADDLYGDLAERFESDDFALGADSELLPLKAGVGDATLPGFQERLDGKAPEQVTTATGGAMARAKIAALKKLNPDSVAWIMVDGTRISLPVVQGEDNEYYLNITFDGQENWAGTVFVSADISHKVTENKNYVIYGHNMEGSQMFSDVTRFLEEEFFYQNRYITLYTEEGLFTYEIFAIFKAHEDDRYFHTYFTSDREFRDFMYEMNDSSLFQIDGMEFTEEDRIITLSTCTNETFEERYALQAKLIKHEE